MEDYSQYNTDVNKRSIAQNISPYEVREADLADIDSQKGDFLAPEFADVYHKHLQGVSDYLDKHMSYKAPEDLAVRRRLLNNAEVRQGPTNFWADPESYGPAAGLQITGRGWNSDIHPAAQIADAGVLFNNPYRVYVNPGQKYEQKNYPSGNLLSHELGHTKQGISWLRGQTDPVKSIPWSPMFPESFLEDLKRLKQTKYNNPTYSGFGSASDPAEIVSYMLGREAQLPAGQTLKDDHVFGTLFKRSPGAYEEYQRTKRILKNIK